MSLLTINGLLPPLLIVLLALISATLLVRDTSANDQHKFASLDGLRGFLALMVFIHHSVFWFNYSHTGNWNGGPSTLYDSFGRASIALFFMLSGFLFTYKLLEGRTKEIDWLRLFSSRVMRLTPLYLALIAAVLVIITLRSSFTQYEDTSQLLANIFSWLLFTIPGDPEINAMPGTLQVSAGVPWTLPYEWYFYLCLPLLGVLLGTKNKANPAIWLVISAICLLTYTHWELDTKLLWGFVAGGIAAAIVRTPWLRALHQGRGMSWIVLSGLIIAYTCFDDGYFYTRLLILGFCFICIACGNTLFGLLTWGPARALSTVSYGIYLLHGLVLYCTFTFVLDLDTRQSLSETQHVLVALAITPVIIGLASAAWYFIEWPAIRATSRLTNQLRKFYSDQPAAIHPANPTPVISDPEPVEATIPATASRTRGNHEH